MKIGHEREIEKQQEQGRVHEWVDRRKGKGEMM